VKLHPNPNTTGNTRFAECRTRQSPHAKKSVGKSRFAECFFIGHSTIKVQNEKIPKK
jgi:hypothetical protein